MAVVLIIGASRGLGATLAQAYLARGDRVLATVRTLEDAERVRAWGAQTLVVDVAQPASVSGLAWQLDGEKIDVALYVPGVWDGTAAMTPPTREKFDHVMHTNVLGAMQVLPQIVPMVEEAEGVIGVFSSEMSLMQDAGSDAWLYRVSKAALNMVVASAQAQWPAVRLVALDPGWVRTAMGGPQATLEPEESAAALMDVIDGITPEDAGQFLRYDGQRIPLR